MEKWAPSQASDTLETEARHFNSQCALRESTDMTKTTRSHAAAHRLRTNAVAFTTDRTATGDRQMAKHNQRNTLGSLTDLTPLADWVKAVK